MMNFQIQQKMSKGKIYLNIFIDISLIFLFYFIIFYLSRSHKCNRHRNNSDGGSDDEEQVPKKRRKRLVNKLKLSFDINIDVQ